MATQPRFTIVCDEVEKRFSETSENAVSNVSLQLRRGASAAIVGPANCGKSTILRMIAGRLPVSQGNIQVLGCDPLRGARALLRRVGWVPTNTCFPPGLFSGEVAKLARDLGQAGDAFAFARICTALGLDPNTRADRLDATTNQLLSLALALQKSPEILLIDDAPEGGGDPPSYFRYLDALRGTNLTFLFAAQRLERVLPFCDIIYLMRDGQIVEEIDTKRGNWSEVRINADALAPALPAPGEHAETDLISLLGEAQPAKANHK
ncbi:MAG: ATP-binding cassette domain-containing protein [Planctomycetota bacterium]